MTDRMAKLDRILSLIHALSDSSEGLTLDEMADLLEVNRRTVERMRDIIARHFDLEDRTDDRVKRFVIRGSLKRIFTRPTAAEVAALKAEVHALTNARQTARALPLQNLLAKVQGALDDREKRRLEPDLDALARLQRTLVPAGPDADVPPETLAQIQGAIMAGQCVEFDYTKVGETKSTWRRVIPHGLLHGAQSYLLGKIVGSEKPPLNFLLGGMSNVRTSDVPGSVPDDFDLDVWLSRSFGIWQDSEGYDVVLRIRPQSVKRALKWRFHSKQQLEQTDDGSLIVRFRAGGLREMAEHLFRWGGELVIEAPEELKLEMRARLEDAYQML